MIQEQVAIEKVAISELRTDRDVARLSDGELLNVHRRLHQLYGAARARGEATEYPFVNVHVWAKAEMLRRGMQHNDIDELDEETSRLEKQDGSRAPQWISECLASASDQVLVPAYMSLVGSVVTKDDPQDIDVLIREDSERLSSGQKESLYLLARKLLDAEKRGKELHMLFNAQGPHLAEGQAYVPLYDLVLRPRVRAEMVTKAEDLRPVARYAAMKPFMAGYTDFRDLNELWQAWGEKASQEAALYVSPKVDGFRTILQRDGDQISIRFEDLREERADQLPGLVAAMKRGPTTFIIEGELQAIAANGQYVARPQILSLLAGNIQATPIVFLYDVLYWDGRDVHAEPFEARLSLIRKAARRLGDDFVVLPQLKATTKAAVEAEARRLLNWQPSRGKGLPIEGIVVRRGDMPYVFGLTSLYAKTKRYVELKMEVLAVNRTANGYTYEVGLRGEDGKPVSLGKTFVSEEKLADVGDTLNVQIEELLLYPDGRVAMGKPTPLGPDRSRPAYTVEQAVDLARRYGALKEIVEAEKQAPEGEGEETRGEAAMQNWEENWQDAMPLSGKALPFILHEHWRGLSEEEAKAIERGEMRREDLYRTNHSVHWDLRLGTDRFNGWWGITLFAGTTAENREKPRIFQMMDDSDVKLQSAPKQFGPAAWLRVGLEKPLIVPPAGVGSTSRAWSAFFAIDRGTWRLGFARQHGVEIWLDGQKLRGRFLWQYAPVSGERIWLFTRPEDQRPYAATHNLDDVLDELTKKGQRHLVWPKNPERLEVGMRLIRVAAKQVAVGMPVRVLKAEAERRFTLAVAYPANAIDTHGDTADPDTVEQMAWEYLRKSRRVGLMHQPGTDGAGEIVESAIWRGPEWRVGDQVVRPGDWLLGIIWVPDVWQDIKRGKLTGLSFQGFAERVPVVV